MLTQAEQEQPTKKRGIGGSGTGISAATREVYGGMVLESKFHALLQELARVRSNDPTAKSLVFSQFSSTIEVWGTTHKRLNIRL